MTEQSGLADHPLDADPAPGEARPVEAVGRLGTQLEWRQVLALVLFALAAVVAALGWYGVSGQADAAEQLPYLASGGLGAALLVALGVTCLVSYEHARDRTVLHQVLADLAELRERFDRVEAAAALEANGTGRPRRSRSATTAKARP